MNNIKPIAPSFNCDDNTIKDHFQFEMSNNTINDSHFDTPTNKISFYWNDQLGKILQDNRLNDDEIINLFAEQLKKDFIEWAYKYE